jgi:hypothetical protein
MNGIVSPQWGPKAATRLRQLNNEGWSAAMIADKLSAEFDRLYTKNAIIGRMDREGLQSHVRVGGWNQAGCREHTHRSPPIQRWWPASRERAVWLSHSTKSPKWKPGRLLARIGWLGL